MTRTSFFWCRQISLDCMFLESQHIIDYSLLLGLHFRAPENLKALVEPPRLMQLPHSLPSEDGKYLLWCYFRTWYGILLSKISDYRWHLAITFIRIAYKMGGSMIYQVTNPSMLRYNNWKKNRPAELSSTFLLAISSYSALLFLWYISIFCLFYFVKSGIFKFVFQLYKFTTNWFCSLYFLAFVPQFLSFDWALFDLLCFTRCTKTRGAVDYS